MSSSNATKVKQNRSIFYSCPGAAGTPGPQGVAGPPGAAGVTGSTGPKGDAGSFTGDLTLAKGVDIDIADSPVNNYILIGNHSFYVITSSNDTPADITGIYGGALGRVLTLVNNTTVVQTFLQEDARSAAPNRFVLGSLDKLVDVNGTITFLYVTGLTVDTVGSQGRWLITSST